MWCVAELNDEYIARMEEVLDLYEKPYHAKEPVICLDEKTLQLLEDKRPSRRMKPGRVLREDSEYVRKGTANIFCCVEPKAGKHITRVTKNRKGPEFAKMISSIERSYRSAKVIHLVMDNLNTHKEKPLIDFYGEKKGKEIWGRFQIHYTPKHGSWLNQAEIEIGLLSRQCLGKDRFSSLKELKKRIVAWNRGVNRRQLKISWKFTKRKARKIFKLSKDKN